MEDPHQKNLFKNSLQSIRFDYSRGRQYQFIKYEDEQSSEQTKFHDIKYRINPETGKVEIEGQRFLKLGKVELYDVIEDRNVDVDREKYIMILDTQTGTAYCFNIKELYHKYISQDRKYVESERGKFKISKDAKAIVLGEIFTE
jgi:hypothetical protein